VSSETVTICIPIYNEIEVIENLISEWVKVVEQLPVGSKIYIEDGGSNDGTLDVLKKFESEFLFIKIFYKDKPDGFGNAAKRLLKEPDTEWIFFSDGDGQYLSGDFWKLWARRNEKDLVKGIKLGRNDPLHRRIISFFWSLLIQIMFGIFISDINAGFVLIRRKALREVIDKVQYLDLLVITEVVIRLITNNCRKSEDVYVIHKARSNGRSRAMPIYKLPFVMYSHFKGLQLIKEDFRINPKR
jgi:glycosyltransferase involved in cell wall biosynthesis